MSEQSYTFQTTTFDNPTSVVVNSTTFANPTTSVVNSTVFTNPESVVTGSYIFTPSPKIKMVSTTHRIARATSGAAGYDIRAIGNHHVPCGATVVVPTGVWLDIPPGLFGLLASRSGLAVTKGITLANGIGIIDSDFHGEVRVAILNSGSDPFQINDGDRVAQLLFMSVAAPDFIAVSNLTPSATRDPSGFGSTGVE